MVRLRRAAVVESMLLRVDAGYRPRAGWECRRACAGMQLSLWFEQYRQGALVCQRCPVRMDCLAHICAVEHDLAIDMIDGYIAVSAKDRRRHARAAIEPADGHLHPVVTLIMAIEDEQRTQVPA